MEPVVSISIVTYNHEKYIAQAIESVIKQNVSFPIELVIGEDCSTDNTRSICLKYRDKYPDIIKLRLAEKNMGMMPNFAENIQACKGKYIALLDGDDYWIDLNKLQKQVDFLDSNPDFAICFHSINKGWMDENGEVRITDAPNIKREISTFENLCAEGCFLQTSTVMIRNGVIEKFPEWYYTAPFGDWPLFLMAARHGKIKKFPEVMSIHREHDGGIVNARWKGNAFSLQILKMIPIMDTYYNHKYKDLFYNYNRIKLLNGMALKYSRDEKKMGDTLKYTLKLMLLTRKEFKINFANTKKLFGLFYRTIWLKNTPEGQAK